MSQTLSPRLESRFESRPAACGLHGEYTAYRIGADWTGCPRCGEDRMRERERREAEDERRASIAHWLRTSGRPLKYAGARFDDSLPPKLREWTGQAIEGAAPGALVIVGSVGTGKTHAACAALLQVIEAGLRACYVTASGYGREVRDTWSRGSRESESRVLERYAEAPFLVLDEIGAGRDIDAPILQDLIGARYDAGLMRRTIVISNLAAARFAEVLGERAADRLKEGALILTMTGASRRRPAAL